MLKLDGRGKMEDMILLSASDGSVESAEITES